LIAMGDLIDAAETREAELGYLGALCRELARFRGERLVLPGNHDLQSLSKDELLSEARRWCAMVELSPLDRDQGAPLDMVEGSGMYGSLERKGVHLVVLDGNYRADGTAFERGNFAWEDAWLSEEQISWLADDLRLAADLPVIVLCHECLFPPQGLEAEQADLHVLRNARRVRDVIEAAGNVCAVLQAHYHPGAQMVINGIPYLALSAMVVGEGSESNAFAIASVYADGRICVEGFGRQASYCYVPRATAWKGRPS